MRHTSLWTLVLATMLAGCTDGATRIANEIESGAAALRSSKATRYSVRHLPEASPGGEPLLIELEKRDGKIVVADVK